MNEADEPERPTPDPDKAAKARAWYERWGRARHKWRYKHDPAYREAALARAASALARRKALQAADGAQRPTDIPRKKGRPFKYEGTLKERKAQASKAWNERHPEARRRLDKAAYERRKATKKGHQE